MSSTIYSRYREMDRVPRLHRHFSSLVRDFCYIMGLRAFEYCFDCLKENTQLHGFYALPTGMSPEELGVVVAVPEDAQLSRLRFLVDHPSLEHRVEDDAGEA